MSSLVGGVCVWLSVSSGHVSELLEGFVCVCPSVLSGQVSKIVYICPSVLSAGYVSELLEGFVFIMCLFRMCE